ncbi:DUF5994 family protein [Streptomyces johnsoniae]|uniref:DUF5994 family protein n=1 Tax=Streptomyces johnsoniae TaxID=3075532 RepID=A0ABU2S0V0_9ACTN|nr:DUF5994 family protein [Streptomyces sp. DSM 41886]MDT0441210.1 DUF5994 family protein [Streptomyces sp. DSM 41886]
MSATTDRPTFPSGRADALPARLALKSPDAPRELLDGAWWPRSRELSRELPALAAVLDPLWGRITRVAVNPRHWPVVPRKVPVGRHVIKVGWFAAELDPHMLLLLSFRVGRWDLLVIPPETSAHSAERLMAAARDASGPPRTASALMADETAHPELLTVWEDEGGAVPPERPRAGRHHERRGPA